MTHPVLTVLFFERLLRSINAELASDEQARLWWATEDAEEMQMALLQTMRTDGVRVH